MWRIPEKWLLNLAGFGGWIGVFAGIHICRHKISKRTFLKKYCHALLTHLMLLYLLCYFLDTGNEEKYSNLRRALYKYCNCTIPAVVYTVYHLYRTW